MMSSVVRKGLNAITGETTKGNADPDMQEVLDQLSSMHGKPIESLDVESARAQPTPADAVMALLGKRGKDTSPTTLVPDVVSVDRTIPGAVGMLEARVYTPNGQGPFPVIVYFHGGGWVIADKDVYDGGARGLSHAAHAIVISVDYRRSPEAKFPAAWEDAIATYQWAAANAGALNGDPSQLALAGESAGGNLAIATAIAVRGLGVTQPLAVVAVYPVGQTGDMHTESYLDSENAKPLNKAMIGWFVDKLIRSPTDKSDTRLDLVHADLAKLPPVTIINAEIDPLRSDGEMLEKAMKDANVEVTRKVYDGVTHEFFGMAALVSKAKDAQAYAGKQLKKAFGF
jgi:acetyl esterase